MKRCGWTISCEWRDIVGTVGAILIAFGLSSIPARAASQPAADKPAEKSTSKPVTTVDPNIDLGDLQLLVDPMTKVELDVEANAWIGLLRAKLREISDAELAVRRKNREIAALKQIKSAAENVAEASAEVKKNAAAAPQSDDARDAAAKLAEAHAKLALAVDGGKQVATTPAPAAAGKKDGKPAAQPPSDKEVMQRAVTKAQSDAVKTGDDETSDDAKMAAAKEEASSGEVAKLAAQTAAPAAVDKKESKPAAQTPENKEIVQRTDAKAQSDAGKSGDQDSPIDAKAAAMKDKASSAETAKTAVVAAANAKTAASTTEKAETLVAKTEEAAAAKADVKVHLVDYSTKLATERTALTDRIKIVLDRFDLLGGDTKDMRAYVAAVSGLKVEISDYVSTIARVKSWIMADEGGLRWARNVGLFLGYIVASVVLAKFVQALLRRSMAMSATSSQLLRQFVVVWSGRVVLALGALAALSALEVNLAPLLAVIGAAGFVVAFALQGTLSNLASGLLILVNKPFDVDDIVEVGGDIHGRVENVSIFSTSIITEDNFRKIVPNNTIWGGVIVNRTTGAVSHPSGNAPLASAVER
jgi:small conductance mechanosensitive channel